jgi:protocatechuate 3,4-dioxygenase beta subunit
VVDVAKGTPLAGAAIYLWHCDRDGNYSLYSSAAADENYLRGVQEADASGMVRFTTIYPACYSGRWPHIHFEVYPSLAEATAAGTQLATSQIALPADVSAAVYATDGYSQSVRNLAQVSLATDNVFGDGAALETPTVTGSVTDGYVVALNVGV